MKKTIFTLIATVACAFMTNAESITNMVIPEHSATIPVPAADTNNSWWISKHNEDVTDGAALPDAKIIFVGASVIDHWKSGEINGYQRGINVWTNHYEPRKALDFGISGDRTQHLLWRMQNGALDAINPLVAVVAVGFNNSEAAQERSEGMLAVVREIRLRCSNTKIIFMPYFPTTDPGWRDGVSFQAYDLACAELANYNDEMVIPLEISDDFVNINGVLKDQALIPDNLHPAEPGYQLWYESMEPTLSSLLNGTIETSVDSLNVPEGSNNTFTVRLKIQPDASITVDVSRVSGDTSLSVSGGSSMIFTTNNWGSWQTVTVSADSDADWTNGTAIVRCSASEINNRDVAVTEIDDNLNPNLQIPFSESFENNATNSGTPGNLNGQHGWTISGDGAALVQNSEVRIGTQALSLSNAVATHTFEDTPSEVWITLWADPVESETGPESFNTNAAAVFYVNTNGHIVAYDSTSATELTGTTVSNGWNQFEIECDYSSKVWNLSLNNVPVVGNFAFYGSPASFQALELTEASRDGTSFFDSITVSNTSDDSDGDGLPDSWENQYWPGDLSHGAGDPAANPDYTIMECYIAGIDPTDENAVFLISDLQPLTSGLSWNAASGRVYSVYWSSNLLGGFQPLGSNLSWTAIPYTDSTHGAENKGFYKIEVEIE